MLFPAARALSREAAGAVRYASLLGGPETAAAVAAALAAEPPPAPAASSPEAQPDLGESPQRRPRQKLVNRRLQRF